ncbi:MAG: PIN domain-containing protein [Nanoarchaeota archaeon]|nr:PIN domain-containing protein [Nanoarchaeota archaeon]
MVDACILFSFFNNGSDRRKIIEKLSNSGCRLISPVFVFEELAKNKEKVKKYGKLDEPAFAFLFSLLELKIESFPKDAYKQFIPEANKISPYGEHIKDDPYFALALAFNSPIWSDEEAFKRQPKVKIFSTKELARLLDL